MVADASQEPASGAHLPRLGHARVLRIVLYAVVVGSVFLGYGVPFFGVILSSAAAVVLYVGRNELWDVGVPRTPLLAVLAWIGLWLPAISYLFTGWYWYLTGRDISTAWLLFPMQGPANFVVGTLVPASAAVVVFAVGLNVAAVTDRPWLVVVGAWLAPWAHELAFNMVTEMG